MVTRLRNGAKVFASRDILSADIFPTASGVYHVSVPKGTMGTIRSTSEKDLYLVEFRDGKGSWYIKRDLVSRNKPK